MVAPALRKRLLLLGSLAALGLGTSCANYDGMPSYGDNQPGLSDYEYYNSGYWNEDDYGGVYDVY